MKHLISLMLCLFVTISALPEDSIHVGSQANLHDTTTLSVDDDTTLLSGDYDDYAEDEDETSGGVFQMVKTKFIEGNPAFMTILTLVLVAGLTISIERLIRLTSIRKADTVLRRKLEEYIAAANYVEASQLCSSSTTPTARVANKALNTVIIPPHEGSATTQAVSSIEASKTGLIERMLSQEGRYQASQLEKGCSWIELCIRIAPSLGFLGTVIGMVMAFDRIETAGDISPTLIAGGMKVALITTIYGIIIALTLQIFYNIIRGKIEQIIADIEQTGTFLEQNLCATFHR